MKMRLYALLLVVGVASSGCIFNQPEEVQNIVKDFNLAWRGDPANRAIYVNIDHEEYGGVKIIDKTVEDIGYNQDFIIARQQVESGGVVFHIIDIRQYSERFWGPDGNLFSFSSEKEFLSKKVDLGIAQLQLSAVKP